MKNIDLLLASACIGLTALLGGWDIPLQVLIIFILTDYVLGVLIGVRDKTLSSKIGFNGIMKKFAILAAVIVATALDKISGLESPWVRTALIYYIIASVEGVSILENLAILGLPMPDFVKNVLAQVDRKGVR